MGCEWKRDGNGNGTKFDFMRTLKIRDNLEDFAIRAEGEDELFFLLGTKFEATNGNLCNLREKFAYQGE